MRRSRSSRSNYLSLNSKIFHMVSVVRAFLYGGENVDHHGGLRRSALARRNICPLRRKMPLRSSSLSHELLSMGCQRAYPQASPCGIPRGTRTTNSKVLSNDFTLQRNNQSIALNPIPSSDCLVLET